VGGLHNALTRGDLTKALKAILGDMKGDGGLERYGETLQPVVNPWELPENRLPRGEATLSRAVAVAAGAAGTFAGAALINRVTHRNRLFVVEKVSVFCPATSQFRVGTTTEATADANFGNQLPGHFLDTRFTVGTAAIRIGFGVPAGIVTSLHMIGVALANTLVYIDELEGCVLHPGFAVFVQTQDDAADFNVNFKWRERVAYPGELV